MDRITQLLALQKESPNDPFFPYALAMEYLEKDPASALPYLESLRNHHPEYAATYYHLANLYLSFGRLQDAQTTFKQGISVCRQQKEGKAPKLLQELETAYEQFLFEYEDDF